MSRVIKMSTPKGKPTSLPKTAALTKAQAEYLSVPVDGPYKPEHYRY